MSQGATLAPPARLGRWAPLVTMLPAGLALVVTTHAYLWLRLVHDVALPPAHERASTLLLVLAGGSIPIGVIASRFVSTRWSRAWLTPVYLWIGGAVFLTLAVGVMDLVRFAGASLGSRTSAVIAALVALGATVAAVREARRLRVERVEVPIAKLPRTFDGLRIVQLSDLHIGPTLGRELVERAVATTRALSPDVVVITGDLVDGDVADLTSAVAPLAELRSRFGTFFVNGNHEYHAGADAWCAHLATLGIRVLRNERVALERDGRAVDLAGLDDYEAARFGGEGPSFARALAGRDPSRALLLLAHQPKAIEEAARHGVDLQLSGHTHGGQLWPLSWIAGFTQPFVAGLGRVEDSFVYVSRGTGQSGPPMRLAVPPEVTLLVLRAGER